MPQNTIDLSGTDPVSWRGLLNLERQVTSYKIQSRSDIFFSPGYTPPVSWRGPMVFTIHDLIHIDVQEESSLFKTLYYNAVVRPSMSRAQRVLTVSEYSRQRLLEWSGVSPEQVVVVGNGVDATFSPEGAVHRPGYPYILYVRNTKPHKNVAELLRAFALMNMSDVRLLLSGVADDDTRHEALRLGILERIVFTGRIPEADLPAYYRGAAVVTMPSLYEGFGLPPLEGMACGVPVVVSDSTSLPEVVGDAGLLIDPRSAESVADGLTRALSDTALRQQMRERGLERAKLFKWDDVADRVRRVLGEQYT
ncbi:glycosyltransferase family 1 protein [Deinococcus psychrotolerans]|uniref:Glycosyltransferase family 1 protein n=2 Tax=Deinococcus psychrotolerans TaxID=2489213 RepID=A0A3G8YRB9_9DEIO|nr:glycosyltransferase family 1 protein [Deinococcus psychrotolerans]